MENEWVRIKEAAEAIDAMDLTPYWKATFFNMFATRGFRNIEDFRVEFEYIAKNETEAIKLLAEGKLVGIETLYTVATTMDSQCQVDYYQMVKAKGVKHADTRSLWNRCTNGFAIPTLFDDWSY
jgi:hypothetical protein